MKLPKRTSKKVGCFQSWFLGQTIWSKTKEPLSQAQLTAVDKEVAALQKEIDAMVEARLTKARKALGINLVLESNKGLGKVKPV